jgi:hypothetical protein
MPKKFKSGDAVYWTYQPRSGFVYTAQVPAVVIEVKCCRARISAKRVDGSSREKWAQIAALMPREEK